MPQTITRTPALAAPIIPAVLVTAAYDASSTSGNRVHEIPGRPDPEVSLRPAGTRAGVIGLVFTSKADAFAAAAAHRGVGVFTLTDDDVPEMGMSYVVAEGGTVRLYLDAETLVHWHLDVTFREVLL